jgi:sialate O-acetylesterase
MQIVKASALLTLCSLIAAGAGSAALRLPALFSDHLVLQAGQTTAIWGWATAAAKVEIQFVNAGGQREAVAAVQAGPDGRWSTRLPALAAGAAGSLAIAEAGGETKIINDVIVGQVWLGGGQSNMTYRVGAANVAAETLAEAKQQAAELGSSTRYFNVAYRGADSPLDDVVGKWVVAGPGTVAGCSAIPWYFARTLQRTLHQPIGLIVSAVGGTPAESWIPRPEFDALHASAAIWQRHRKMVANFTPDQDETYKGELAVWLAKYPTPQLQFANSHSHPREPYSPSHSTVPVRLYNAMIHGLESYTAKGIIWFQGDGNGAHPEEYPELIRTVIQTWRKQWGAELPVYYLEINNMFEKQKNPVENGALAPIREAQNAALELPRTGVVSTIDLGIAEDAHFPVKQPAGDRMARLILSEIYSVDLGEVHSPEFSGMAIQGNRIRLHFAHAEGLRTRTAEVKGFALRGFDGSWVWGDGKIEAGEIVVWNAQIEHPTAVRYDWANNPIGSIENAAGLPLRPFRTDKESPK